MRTAFVFVLALALPGCITDALCGPPSAPPPPHLTRGQIIEEVGWAACEHQRACMPRDFSGTIEQCVLAMKAHEPNQSALTDVTPDGATACEHAYADAVCGVTPRECAAPALAFR